VPAILGGAAALTAATTVMMPSAAAGDTEATTLLSTPAPIGGVGPVDTVPSTTTKKRSPWTWPLIALIALLAVVLIGTIIALLAQPKGGGTPVTTAHTTAAHTTPPPSPTPTPTQTSTTVQINESDFVGKTSAEARNMLQSLGMVADVQPGQAATSQGQVDTVYSVNPTGPVPRGTTISVKVFGPVAAITPPTDTPTTVPPGQTTASPGENVVLKFGGGSCPAGQTLTGRQMYVNGAGKGPLPATTTTYNWTVANTDGPTAKITYTIFCGESVESGQSQPLSVTVAATTP
jgi:serine/threonine-protein kinase